MSEPEVFWSPVKIAVAIGAVILGGTLFVIGRYLQSRQLQTWLVARRQEIYQICKATAPEDTIFVSVASYRDPECADTVFDLFQKAACPYRIYVGVCQQNYPVDEDVMTGYTKMMEAKGVGDFRNQIRVYSLDASSAKGPMLARSYIEQYLYRQEKYYLVIDSHTIFANHWDLKAIHMLKQCPSAKPVLTMYPENYTHRNHTCDDMPASYFRFKRFNDKARLPEIEGPLFRQKLSHPCPSLFWGACFSFTLGQVISEVPFDPHCPYVFIGEEISMAARLFTHGWDLYHPLSMLVLHRWNRLRPTFWEQFQGTSQEHVARREAEQKGYARLRTLMGLRAADPQEVKLGIYGLGTVRTLAEYEKYCGLNFLLQTAQPHAIAGVSVKPSQEEIMSKFGSMGAYYAAIRQV